MSLVTLISNKIEELYKKIGITSTHIFIFLIIIGLLLRLYEWNRYALAFFDEGIHGYFGIVSSYDLVLGTLYQMPLFFWIEGLVYLIFKDPIYFRLLNIVLSVISLILCYIWIRKEFFKESLLSLLFLSTSFIHIVYSQYVNHDSLVFCIGMSALITSSLFFDKRNKIFLILTGIMLGLGTFTKITFPIFHIVILLYFLFYKKASVKDLIYVFAAELITLSILFLPYIYLAIVQPGDTYSIFNYFNAYFTGVNMSVGFGFSFERFMYYSGESLFSLGLIFLFFIYYLLMKNSETKYNFLVYWVLIYFILLSVSPWRFLRYLLMQGLALVPFTIIASKVILSLKKQYIILCIILILSLNIFHYYNFFINHENPSDASIFRYLENEALIKAIEYVYGRTSASDYILTNEPYAFLTYPGRRAYTIYYSPHYNCPNKNIKYFVLINSSYRDINIDVQRFDLNTISQLPIFKLEKTFSSEVNTVYIYNVTGSNSCPLPIPPYQNGLYLSDII